VQREINFERWIGNTHVHSFVVGLVYYDELKIAMLINLSVASIRWTWHLFRQYGRYYIVTVKPVCIGLPRTGVDYIDNWSSYPDWSKDICYTKELLVMECIQVRTYIQLTVGLTVYGHFVCRWQIKRADIYLWQTAPSVWVIKVDSGHTVVSDYKTIYYLLFIYYLLVNYLFIYDCSHKYMICDWFCIG
jgi:hypothetical protein